MGATCHTGRYGKGLKTGTIRLGGSALIFTRSTSGMACGLLSPLTNDELGFGTADRIELR